MRFSIRLLLGLVTFIAIAIGSLLNANQLWFQVLLTATILLFVIGTLVAIGRTGAARAFWIGFVVIGCAYSVAVFGFRPQNKYLLTPKLLEYLYPQVKTEITADSREELLEQYPDAERYITELDPPALSSANLAFPNLRVTFHYQFPKRNEFDAIGHCLFTLTFAFIGGSVAKVFYITMDTSAS